MRRHMVSLKYGGTFYPDGVFCGRQACVRALVFVVVVVVVYAAVPAQGRFPCPAP